MDFVQSHGSREGLYSPREVPAELLIVHTTGAGLYNRWKKENPGITSLDNVDLPNYTNPPTSWSEWKKRKRKEPTPFDTALRVYGSLMKAGPHFVVCGETGRIAQTAELDECAWHVGSLNWKEKRAYSTGKFLEKCPWWKDKFPEYNSPLDFLGGRLWDEHSVNQLSYGIEIAPPIEGARAPLDDVVIDAIDLIHKLTGCLQIYTHSDVSPLDRTSRGVQTDVPVNWEQQLLLCR